MSLEAGLVKLISEAKEGKNLRSALACIGDEMRLNDRRKKLDLRPHIGLDDGTFDVEVLVKATQEMLVHPEQFNLNDEIVAQLAGFYEPVIDAGLRRYLQAALLEQRLRLRNILYPPQPEVRHGKTRSAKGVASINIDVQRRASAVLEKTERHLSRLAQERSQAAPAVAHLEELDPACSRDINKLLQLKGNKKIRLLQGDEHRTFTEDWKLLFTMLSLNIELVTYDNLTETTDLTSPIVIPAKMKTRGNGWRNRSFASVIVTEVSAPRLLINSLETLDRRTAAAAK